jgi:YqaJ-like viral recombinase domain
MKEIKVEQGSPEWVAARLGLPTASNFDKILTPGGKLSEQARKYAFYLAAELLLNRQLDNIDYLDWVARGKELEPTAVQNYEYLQEVKTKQVGLITTDDGRIGASPDRLIEGVKGGLEIKCPSPQIHMGYMIDGFGKAYKVQVQGQMYVAELDFVDRYAFHPEMPPVLERTTRDEPFIALLSDALSQFCDDLAEIIRKAKASGFFQEREALLTSHNDAYNKSGNKNG